MLMKTTVDKDCLMVYDVYYMCLTGIKTVVLHVYKLFLFTMFFMCSINVHQTKFAMTWVNYIECSAMMYVYGNENVFKLLRKEFCILQILINPLWFNFFKRPGGFIWRIWYINLANLVLIVLKFYRKNHTSFCVNLSKSVVTHFVHQTI